MKYLIAKILSEPVRFAAICHDSGGILAQSESLQDLHSFCHAHGMVCFDLWASPLRSASVFEELEGELK